MKLRNKQTGEIGEIGYIGSSSGKLTVNPINRVACESIAFYNSLAELNKEWEDYEEPENFYIVEQRGTVGSRFRTGDEYEKMFKEIGNYFETKEEAELALRKLKAWKRLKDKGFRFDGFYDKSKQHILWHCGLPYITDDEFYKDLDSLFGGEK